MNITLRMQTVFQIKVTKEIAKDVHQEIFINWWGHLLSSKSSQLNYSSSWMLFLTPVSQKLYTEMPLTITVVAKPIFFISSYSFCRKIVIKRLLLSTRKTQLDHFPFSNRNFKKIFSLLKFLSFNHKYILKQKPRINLISWWVSGIWQLHRSTHQVGIDC